MIASSESLLANLRRLAPFGWNTAASIANQGSSLLTNILIANLTSVELYGQYAAMLATLVALVSITQLSAWLTATRYTAALLNRDNEALGRIIGTLKLLTLVSGGLATLALVIGGYWYAEHVLHTPTLGLGVVLSAGYVLFMALNSLQAGILLGSGAIAPFARASIVLSVLVVGISLAGLMLFGIEGALAALATGAALRFAATEWIVRRVLTENRVSIPQRAFGSSLSVIWRFAAPASANSLTYAGTQWLASLLIVNSREGVVSMAFFSAAVTLKNLVLFIPMQVNMVSVSYLAKSYERSDHTYRKIFLRNLVFLTAMAFAAALIIVVFAEQFMSIYSNSFRAGASLLRLYAVGLVIEALAFAIMQHFSSRAQMWGPFILGSIPRDITFIGLLVALIPAYGVNGVGFAYCMSWAVCVAGYLVLMRVDTTRNRVGGVSRQETRD